MAKQTKASKPRTSFKQKLDNFFEITKRGSTFKTEIIAGLTTFFAMAYIVVTNPDQIVGSKALFIPGARSDFDRIWFAVYVSSIIVAIVGTLLMALYAKMPFAQACGMGLNSFFFVSFIVPEFATGEFIKGYKEGLAVILLSGLVFMILSFTGLRTHLAKALPECLKKAIPAGIGIFIALLGFKSVDLVQRNKYTLVQFFDFKGIADATKTTVGGLISAHEQGNVSDAVFNAYDSIFHYTSADADTLAKMLDVDITGMHAWTLIAPALITILGLVVMGVLAKKKVKGSVIITILGSTVLYYLATWQLPSFTLTSIKDSFYYFGKHGLFGAFEGLGTIFQPSENSTVWGAIFSVIALTITFCLVDMFDTMGTLYGAASQGNMLDENGDPINLNKCMNSDSLGTLSGAVLGTSTCTTLVESTAGIGAGGRTGLASLITAACFFVCLFLTPVATIIPACATAPALIYIGVLMLSGFGKVDMDDLSSAIPAFLTLVMMPLTYSISNGIAIGAISYVLIRLFTGKYEKKDIAITAIAILFALRFAFISL